MDVTTMELRLCPNCQQKVVFSPSGECPSCRTTLGAVNVAQSQEHEAGESAEDRAAAQNPYASPLTANEASDAGPTSAALTRVYYPIALRYWAAGIDNFFAIVCCLLVGKQLEDENLPAIQAIAVIATFFFYYLVPESLFAATPGKLIMGIKVASRDGRPCTAAQALVRNLLRIVDANPFSGILVGSLVVVLTKHKQRIGDLLAGTVVVRR
jgi:uncharacterized RDD family membrane protein YckC